jgi:glycopeptide antibiotics resistance protein
MADEKKKEEKTFFQQVGTILGYILVAVIALMIAGPLFSIGMNGIDGIISAIGNGAHHSVVTLHNAHIHVMQFSQKVLQVLFQIATLIALGIFLAFLLKKIVEEIKKWGDKK